MIAEERAYAKINLSLDVRGKRQDGFHDMVMIMQTVSLCDEITVESVNGTKVTATSNLPYIPKDEKNLAVKAANIFLTELGETAPQGFKITIRKNIPVGAGMGGGSSDAAAVLRAMNALYGNALSSERLLELAAKVGSDVAFCVAGGTALAQGRGELLTDLPPLPDCTFVICKPEFSISTPELFGKLDKIKLRRHPDTNGMIEALKRENLPDMCRRMYNVFEDVDDRRLREVTRIKGVLLDCCAEGAIMTGTGSSVFGIFTEDANASRACERLKSDYKFCCTAKPQGRLM